MASGKNRPCCELTDQEKAELAKKVYPALKTAGKKTAFIRILKISHGMLLCILLMSCAADTVKQTVQPPVEKPLDAPAISMIFKNQITKPDDPKEFEMVMPESDYSLGAVYKFSKEPTVVNISDNVTDFDYEKGLLAVLKDDRLTTNMTACPQVNLTEKYDTVTLSGDLALLIGQTKTSIADIKQCALVMTTDTQDKGFSLSDAGYMEVTKQGYVVYDRYKTRAVFNGSFLGAIMFGKIGSRNAVFATDTGKIAMVSLSDGKFKAISGKSLKIAEIQYSGDDIYVLTEDHKLIRMQADFNKGEIVPINESQAKEGCFMLKRGGMMYCDGYIVGTDYAYKSPIKAEKGLLNEGMLFLVNENSLYFVDKELVYRKSIDINSKGEPKLCLKDGKAYFHDLDGSDRYFTADGTEYPAESYPADCDHDFGLDLGMLKSADGKVIYKFADEVNRSVKAVMLKRIIGQDIYYYFDPLK